MGLSDLRVLVAENDVTDRVLTSSGSCLCISAAHCFLKPQTLVGQAEAAKMCLRLQAALWRCLCVASRQKGPWSQAQVSVLPCCHTLGSRTKSFMQNHLLLNPLFCSNSCQLMMSNAPLVEFCNQLIKLIIMGVRGHPTLIGEGYKSPYSLFLL